jgi:hypothetical protein
MSFGAIGTVARLARWFTPSLVGHVGVAGPEAARRTLAGNEKVRWAQPLP